MGVEQMTGFRVHKGTVGSQRVDRSTTEKITDAYETARAWAGKSENHYAVILNGQFETVARFNGPMVAVKR